MGRRRASLLLVLLALPATAAGCVLPWPDDDAPPPPEERPYVLVDPPPLGGGFAPCATPSAAQLALGFTATEVPTSGGRPEGIHRLNDTTFLWVWARYANGTLREDDVRRVNEVQVFQEHDGRIVLCTRVEIVTPLEVDPQPRTYDVAVRLTAHRPRPPAPLRLVVNWVAGCATCGRPSQGNATADWA